MKLKLLQPVVVALFVAGGCLVGGYAVSHQWHLSTNGIAVSLFAGVWSVWQSRNKARASTTK